MLLQGFVVEGLLIVIYVLENKKEMFNCDIKIL